jgi:hypothetical protein
MYQNCTIYGIVLHEHGVGLGHRRLLHGDSDDGVEEMDCGNGGGRLLPNTHYSSSVVCSISPFFPLAYQPPSSVRSSQLPVIVMFGFAFFSNGIASRPCLLLFTSSEIILVSGATNLLRE